VHYDKETDSFIINLKKGFVLACRFISDNFNCPAVDEDVDFPECDEEIDECGDGDVWECWQKYFYQVVENEMVCRVCGCTCNNACEGSCFWVKPDLCSKCVVKEVNNPAEVGSNE